MKDSCACMNALICSAGVYAFAVSIVQILGRGFANGTIIGTAMLSLSASFNTNQLEHDL